MRPTAINRLERLERVHGGTRINCIERVIYGPSGGQVEPSVYRDALGNRWERRPGEMFGQFQMRVQEEAVSAASPRIARIIGGNDD
jgi:hypothetical protein